MILSVTCELVCGTLTAPVTVAPAVASVAVELCRQRLMAEQATTPAAPGSETSEFDSDAE